MDGVNVAYLTTYKYSECIVWEPAKCIADTNYENNGHSYSTIEIEHWANGTFTSWEVSENDGKYTYDITLDCNDGTLENPSEASHVLISCDENFDESTTTAWLCEAWTKQWTCWWTIPDNAAATTETTFDQTWDPTANEWDPLTWVWWEAHEYCDFDCDESFVWDGSLCKSNAQECPIENGVWSQLWDDTLNNYGNCSLVECNADFHTEDDTTCVSNTKQESCIDSAPTSGTSTISQVDVTWNGTTWSEPEVCLWSCNADYHTEDNLTCVSDLKQEACTDSAPLNGTSTAVQVDVTWNGTTWTEPEVCLWTCNTDYHTDDNLTCISDSDQLACIDSAPTNGTSTIVQVPVTWDGSAWSTPETCDWSCDTDYHTIDNTTCTSDTRSCDITNWTWTQTWNSSTTSWNTCTVATCDNWYETTNNTCVLLWTVQDSNCSLPDVTIGSQTWAGCNSTLWIWIDYTPWHCYNYAWTNNWSNCGWYSSKESDYNSVWVDNIWGKLYTWDNAQNACGTWYHLPSIEEWTTAMISLGCTDTVSSTTTWWKCAWLWWKNNGTLKDKLKMPLAGLRNTGGVSFYGRGYSTYLWASSVSGSDGRWVDLFRGYDAVDRNSRDKAYGFSVRCIKD